MATAVLHVAEQQEPFIRQRPTFWVKDRLVCEDGFRPAATWSSQAPQPTPFCYNCRRESVSRIPCRVKKCLRRST